MEAEMLLKLEIMLITFLWSTATQMKREAHALTLVSAVSDAPFITLSQLRHARLDQDFQQFFKKYIISHYGLENWPKSELECLRLLSFPWNVDVQATYDTRLDEIK